MGSSQNLNVLCHLPNVGASTFNMQTRSKYSCMEQQNRIVLQRKIMLCRETSTQMHLNTWRSKCLNVKIKRILSKFVKTHQLLTSISRTKTLVLLQLTHILTSLTTNSPSSILWTILYSFRQKVNDRNAQMST